MPQINRSISNESCLASISDETSEYSRVNSITTNSGKGESFPFEPTTNLEVEEKSPHPYRYHFRYHELKYSPGSNASSGLSLDKSWSTGSSLQGTESPLRAKGFIDSLISQFCGEDQSEQPLSMKTKENMGERKERLKCVGIDPTYRAFMDEELSQSSQGDKKADDTSNQSTTPRRDRSEQQTFPNREVMKVLDSVNSRFSNFFSDSQTSISNHVEQQPDGFMVNKTLEESVVLENSHFSSNTVDVNLEENYENNQQLPIKGNIDPKASLEYLTNDEISNSLEKIFTETASAESSNVFLKDEQAIEMEIDLESGDITFSEKADGVHSDISNIVVTDDSENLQTIMDEVSYPVDRPCGDNTFSVEPESIDTTSNCKEGTAAQRENEGNLTVPEANESSSIQTSECLYKEIDSNNQVTTNLNVHGSEINALNKMVPALKSINFNFLPCREIQDSVLYSHQQNLKHLNDVAEIDANDTLVETKRDIISEAYLEAMTGCIDDGILEECVSVENRFVDSEINFHENSRFMEISNNFTSEPTSEMDVNKSSYSHPTDVEMSISTDNCLNVPKARKSLPSTPLKSAHLEQDSIGFHPAESKLNLLIDSSVLTDNQKETQLSSDLPLISDSDPQPQKSTARKSIRGRLLKSSSPTNSDSSCNDASNVSPHKRRKLEDAPPVPSPIKPPTTAMKTFVRPFTVAKKSVAEQSAYKTVFQALGVKTAMKTIKPPNSKTSKDKEGKAIVVSLNDNELSVEEMSPDDSKNTPLYWSLKELIPQRDVCCCSAEKVPCLLNGEPLQLMCEAEDSINELTIPCGKKVNQQYLLTPSSRIERKALCDVHLWRLQKHQCCSKCGNFCTQGMFLLCSSSDPLRGGKQSHLFHTGCLVVPGIGLPPSCPHCCKFSEFKEVRLVLLENDETEESFHNIDKDAKSITNELENYSVIMQVVNVEPKNPLDGNFSTESYKQELLSMVMAITGEKSLHLRPSGKCLLNPIKNGDIKKVLQLIVNGVNPNHKFKTHKNNTPLHIGAYYGFTSIVSVLIQYGADINALNDDLETPLILAVERNQYLIVRYLVYGGAQVDDKNENGLNAFHVAAKNGCKEIGEFLYRTGKFKVNIQDDGGWTPLVWACEKGFTDYVEWLLELGADPSLRDNEENTALHWAACTGNSDILTMFLDHGCNLTFVNQRGDSALHIAARKDNFSCVKLLLKRGAPVDVKNKEGETPLQCCDMGTKSLRMLKRHVSRMVKDSLLHNVVYRDISRGTEDFPIQAINEVDTEEFIMDFRYIIRNCYGHGVKVVATVDSMKVCLCKDNCSSNNCTCVKLSKCWYDMDGLLVPDFDLNDPPSIYECNKTCHCPKTCINRIVQHGLKLPLQVFRTLTMGWGVRTLKELPKGTFVCEYIGEVLDGRDIFLREDDSYFFNLESKTGKACLDGRFYGNVARFINHSCDPNLVGVRVFIEHQDLNFPRIAFFTLRDVEALEELCFDYGIHFWIVKSQTTLCTCNSNSCKYSKDSIDDTFKNYFDQLVRT